VAGLQRQERARRGFSFYFLRFRYARAISPCCYWPASALPLLEDTSRLSSLLLKGYFAVALAFAIFAMVSAHACKPRILCAIA